MSAATAGGDAWPAIRYFLGVVALHACRSPDMHACDLLRLDYGVGNVTDAMEARGMWDSSFVIFHTE